MATVYGPPKGFEPPSIKEQMDYDFKIKALPEGGHEPSEYDRKHDEYIERLSAHARAQHPNPDPAIGEVIRFGVGDGSAEYVVWNTKPLQLIHVAWGDSWHADPILIRGLRLTDVRQLIKREQTFARIFGGAG
jgi:hypothetical protein